MLDVLNSDLVVAVVVALLASVFAFTWPAIAASHRRRRFRKLVKRELEEIAPHDPDQAAGHSSETFDPSIPWHRYLQRRFLHEQVLSPEAMETHRDFVLALDPALVYYTSQLWSSYHTRDLGQWCHYLEKLSNFDGVATPKLSEAVKQWQSLSRKNPPGNVSGATARGRRADSVPQAVIEKRLEAFGELLKLRSSSGVLGRTSAAEDDLHRWFYTGANGLLLSGDALTAFRDARAVLQQTDSTADDVDNAMTRLRTELKIDLGVRGPEERDIPLRPPAAENSEGGDTKPGS